MNNYLNKSFYYFQTYFILILLILFPTVYFSQVELNTFNDCEAGENQKKCLIDNSKKIDISIGLYITSIRNIDYKNNSFYADFWLYLNFPNPIIDTSKRFECRKCIQNYSKGILNTLEWPDAIDDNNGGQPKYNLLDVEDDFRADILWICAKVSVPIRSNWKLKRYPFDIQKIEFKIESTQNTDRFLLKPLKFNIDSTFKQKLTETGVEITDDYPVEFTTTYKTNFGDPNDTLQESKFSTISYSIKLTPTYRWSLVTFFKLYTGIFISFLLSLSVFFIHSKHLDARFGLCIGAMFSAIGSKYVVDSIIPASNTNTLFDDIHNLTFVLIFFITIISIISLKWSTHSLNKKLRIAAKELDKYCFRFFSIMYLILIGSLVLSACILRQNSSEYDPKYFILFLTLNFSISTIYYLYTKLKKMAYGESKKK